MSASGTAPGKGEAVCASDAIHLALFQESQQVVREQLSTSRLSMFHDLTGMLLHVEWLQPLGLPWPARAVGEACPTAAEPQNSNLSDVLRCPDCLEQHWPHNSEANPVWFNGNCGTRNLCVCLEVSHVPIVRLLAQWTPGSDGSRAPPSDQTFSQAAALVQLIVHDLQATLRAHFAERELHLIDSAAGGSEPPASESGAEAGLRARRPPGPHAQQVVQMMLDYVRDHYQRPMALKEVAAVLGLNANYLSGLFRRVTGTTFHRYVHAVRMSKAETLLRNPRLRVCDVASAVGYASPNHFRNAFKASEKVSPKAWAERHEAGRWPSWPGPWEQDPVEI
jgi:AraC-like DNA-binding protein